VEYVLEMALSTVSSLSESFTSSSASAAGEAAVLHKTNNKDSQEPSSAGDENDVKMGGVDGLTTPVAAQGNTGDAAAAAPVVASDAGVPMSEDPSEPPPMEEDENEVSEDGDGEVFLQVHD
jgi:hypothetical protein